ncbi:SGNH/GDSL hydrolase family protein [Aspergillus nidulans FGSC A4]|uniref:Lysophospholipase A, putative (AFU_orthologue AFUA_2G10760) n=1 Tax=Emericella nidulans (strain FGSC A4 / ATCC 38163 / CBS 112.46 / NRRL 194 / M139) TaxID=227321 RepID=C8V3J1_EMENI|nr:hypothetical protein [Aspergillus nidulans FGSC A4]CBF70544.1 TPA: lysophospholipase A, putative (AFU_orthologue; AFUA_2G10760) [Aspergillus nidulans FGSC A4]
MLAATFILALMNGNSLTSALPFKPITRSRHGFDWDSTRNLIAFGDSYTFIQGTHGYPNYSFIGDQLNYAYDARTLLTDKIVQNQTGTSAGGPNWVEFLTGCGLKEGLTSPISCTKQLWDFAFAGAGVSAEHIPLHHPYTISLVNQIRQFTIYGHLVLTSSSQHPSHKATLSAAPILDPASTLTAIWIGINDINDSAKNSSISSFPDFYNTLLQTAFSGLQTLVSLGYKDFVDFVVLNLPPLDRTPANQARTLRNETAAPDATQVGWFNSAITSQARRFGRRNPDTNVLVFDAHRVLSHVLDFPDQYGIVNTTDFCPGYDQPDIETEYQAYGCPTSLGTYFWFNSGHITSRLHEILAAQLSKTLERWRG